MTRAMRSCLMSLLVCSPDRKCSVESLGGKRRRRSRRAYLGLLGKLQPGHYEGCVRGGVLSGLNGESKLSWEFVVVMRLVSSGV